MQQPGIPLGIAFDVKFNYKEILQKKNNLYYFTYPLETNQLSAKPVEKLNVQVEIIQDKPIGLIYSPTHKINIKRINEKHSIITYELINEKPEENINVDKNGIPWMSFVFLGVYPQKFKMNIMCQRGKQRVAQMEIM